MRDIPPLLKGVPHLRLIISKLIMRSDFKSLIAQAIRRMRTLKHSQATKAKEALITEIQKRKK